MIRWLLGTTVNFDGTVTQYDWRETVKDQIEDAVIIEDEVPFFAPSDLPISMIEAPQVGVEWQYYDGKEYLGTPKFVSPMPLPTPYERELLIIALEEATEVMKRITKMLRFGRDEVQPGQDLSNRDRLSLEIGDLYGVIGMLDEAGLVNQPLILAQIPLKITKVKHFLQSEQPK